ncbi:hypothetical protein HDZ31DRAFT_66528 [Schizophyllum fasciatum]
MSQLVKHCSLDEFKKTYMERLGWKAPGKRKTQAIVSHLVKKGKLTDGGWVALESWKTGNSSNPRFRWIAMGTLVRAVLAAAEQVIPSRFSHEKRTADFECRYRTTAPLYASDANAPQVDAFTVLQKKGPRSVRPGSATDRCLSSTEDSACGVVHAADVGVTVFWDPREGNSGTPWNRRQSSRTASYMLYNDRRRSFHLSLTIRHTTAQVWWHSRSHSIHSYAFDINEMHTELIHFILFAHYANEEQLGFDPSVTRVVDDVGRLQYQFDTVFAGESAVRTYQTIRVINEASPNYTLHDRAMAVYLVCPAARGDGESRVIVPAEYRVLRDFFQLVDQPDELAERNRVLKKMKSVARNPRELAMCEKAFVSVLADYDVHFDLSLWSPLRKRALALVPRRRRRSVYGEVCQDLYGIGDARVYYFAMGECTSILLFMLRAGIVHEDISPGNFLVHAKDDRCARDGKLSDELTVKITDFEYTKDYSQVKEGAQMGTPCYMAIEVQAAKHLFYDADAPQALLARHRFSYNPYHDLESVLWMALDFAMINISSMALRKTARAALSRQAWWQVAFHDKIFVKYFYGTVARRQLMMGDRTSLARLKLVLQRAYGKTSPIIGLVALVVKMGRAHRAAQMSQEDQDTVPNLSVFKQLNKDNFDEGIYHEMRRVFTAISESFSGREGELVNARLIVECMPQPEDPEQLWRDLDVAPTAHSDDFTDDDASLYGLAPSKTDSERLTEERMWDSAASNAHAVGKEPIAECSKDSELANHSPAAIPGQAGQQNDAAPFAGPPIKDCGEVTLPWLKRKRSPPSSHPTAKKIRKRVENKENTTVEHSDHKLSFAGVCRKMFGATKLGNYSRLPAH